MPKNKYEIEEKESKFFYLFAYNVASESEWNEENW